jgi:hypothetical protein
MKIVKVIITGILCTFGVIFILAMLSTPKTKVIERMPREGRDAFMLGCDPEGKQTSYCECSLSYMEEHHSVGEISDMAIKYDKDGVMPEMINEAAKSCINLYVY